MYKILSLFFITTLFLSCDEVCLNEQEKTSMAHDLVQSKMQEVVSLNYEGGNNIQYEIQQIDYDCLNTTMKIKAKLIFEGQYTGIQYWSVGVFTLQIADRSWRFDETQVDPLLKTSLKIGEEAKKELLNTIEENY